MLLEQRCYFLFIGEPLAILYKVQNYSYHDYFPRKSNKNFYLIRSKVRLTRKLPTLNLRVTTYYVYNSRAIKPAGLKPYLISIDGLHVTWHENET